jgi:hypothetical protein
MDSGFCRNDGNSPDPRSGQALSYAFQQLVTPGEDPGSMHPSSTVTPGEDPGSILNGWRLPEILISNFQFQLVIPSAGKESSFNCLHLPPVFPTADSSLRSE